MYSTYIGHSVVTFSNFFFNFIYMKVTDRQLPSVSSLLKCQPQSGLGVGICGASESTHVSHTHNRDPTTQAFTCCLPQMYIDGRLKPGAELGLNVGYRRAKCHGEPAHRGCPSEAVLIIVILVLITNKV